MKRLSVQQGARLVRGGGVIAYPTETVYGLGADPKNREALKKIFKIKGRDKGKPILILISSRPILKKWVKGVGRREKVLMDHFWPGPLTLVFRAKRGVLSELTGGTGKLGVRFSSHKMAQALCRLSGGALTSTSANRSGKGALRTARAVGKNLGKNLAGVVSGAHFKKSKGSTILDISNLKIKVIREGDIAIKKIKNYLKKKGFPHVEF